MHLCFPLFCESARSCLPAFTVNNLLLLLLCVRSRHIFVLVCECMCVCVCMKGYCIGMCMCMCVYMGTCVGTEAKDLSLNLEPDNSVDQLANELQ